MNNLNKAILRLSILLASVCLLTNPQAVHAQIPFSFIASSPYDLDAQILFAKYNAAGTPATTTRKAQLNTLIKDLKAAGIWDKLDCFYLWAAHSKSAALIDIKNPSRTATIVSDYAGSFVTDSHFASNGTCVINTNYNPGDGGSYNFTMNDNSFGTYIRQHGNNANLVDLSALNASNAGNEIFFLNNTFSPCSYNGTTTYYSVAYLTTAGLVSSKRASNSTFEIQHDGYDLYGGGTKQAATATVLPNVSFILGGRNTNGTVTLKSTHQHSYTFFGASSIDAFVLNQIINRDILTPYSINLAKRVTLLGNSMTFAVDYPARTMSTIGYNYAVNWVGVSGYTFAQLTTLANSLIIPKATTQYSKDVLVLWECTNTMAGNSSNALSTHAQLKTLSNSLRAAGYKVIVATMLPRNSAQINNANRQNDSNLNDTLTLNGKIRAQWSTYADGLADVASDAVMGIYSNGIVGVGERNTTYYKGDMIHPTTAGYQRLADNFITPALQTLLAFENKNKGKIINICSVNRKPFKKAA